MRSIWIGYDPKETESFAVARRSLQRHAPEIPIQALDLAILRDVGLYTRPTSVKDMAGKPMLWDEISGAPMSTEFAISRFLTPYLAGTGWALFCDCDVMALEDIRELFRECDPKYAVMCVQHVHYVPENLLKKDNQIQTVYQRKNWSSVMAFNCDHPANRALTVELVNSVPGRDLHRFCWLEDKHIGALHPGWNHLVGISSNTYPRMVHFTNGTPNYPGYENQPYADEWRRERHDWLMEGVRIQTWLRDRERDSAQGELLESIGATF